MRDKGFGGGRELGEEVKAILGFIDPGWLTGVELELLGGRDWPATNTHTHSNVVITAQETMLEMT